MNMQPYVTNLKDTSDKEVEEGSADAKTKLIPDVVSGHVEAAASSRPGFAAEINMTFQEWYARERSPEELYKRRICQGIFFLVVFCTGLGVLIASLRKVEETSFGVEYNVHSKQLDDAAKSGGLFLGPPGYEFIKFPSTFITVDLNDRLCVSRDGLRVSISATFQYKMIEANVLPAILKYRDFDKWADVVEAAGLSAIHHSCGNYVISDFQNKRGEIQFNMEDNLRIKLEGNPEDERDEGVFALVASLQLQNIELPSEYNEAVQEKQAAEEDIPLAKNERKQETTKAQTELLRAIEEARKILDTANNEAEVLLTEAGLKAEETTFIFEKEAETILDVKESLNLTTEGVLAYLYNALLADAPNLKITTGEPAKLSRSEEL
jgi:regulator of protease activity HflC (stomatin/prohibitin superfamily)